MTTAVIYSSKRGSTLKYATWIAGELEASLIPIETCDLHSLDSFDMLVYGGWLRGSGIVGFDKFKKGLSEEDYKRLVVFAVGISGYSPENYMQIFEINLGDDRRDVPLYLLKGAYDPKKVTGLDKVMMGVAKQVLMSGSVPDESGKAMDMKEMIEQGVDMVDISEIKPVVKAARTISEKMGSR